MKESFKKKVLILGADGYCGWPTVMHLAARGYQVTALDNFYKRRLTNRLSVTPLIPVPPLEERQRHWDSSSSSGGNHPWFTVVNTDVTDFENFSQIVARVKPDAIVHFAEQPSAPYSMLDYESARDTLTNNLIGTLNVVHAVHRYAPSCHIVKLATMGEYGTPNIDIPEGWIDIDHKGRRDRFLFPRQASSLYHTTKIQDTDLLWFYVRIWGLRVTDLMQGPVYGWTTPESGRDVRLMPHIWYDELFGTVVNRFVVQAAAGFSLTVYGKGNQRRGYISLEDMTNCVRLAIESPPKEGELRILNQVTEVFSVNELADRVARVGRSLGRPVEVAHIKNPRVEKEDHYYNPAYTGFQDLGLTPHRLDDDLVRSMLEIADRYRNGITPDQTFRGIRWGGKQYERV